MHSRTRVAVAVAAASFFSLAGCAPQDELAPELGAPEAAVEKQNEVASNEEALRIDLNPNAIAYDYFNSLHVPHGIAGTEQFVFVAQPLSGRVSVVDRLLGREIATLAPPPGGWLLPFRCALPTPASSRCSTQVVSPTPTFRRSRASTNTKSVATAARAPSKAR